MCEFDLLAVEAGNGIWRQGGTVGIELGRLALIFGCELLVGVVLCCHSAWWLDFNLLDYTLDL